MPNQQPPSGKLIWAALRQQQALRESLAWTLKGDFMFRLTKDEAFELEEPLTFGDTGWTLASLDDTTLPAWLKQQGLGDHIVADMPSIAAAIDGYRLALLKGDAYQALKAGQLSAQDGDDFGADRSGAGWTRSINFCITSAFVRLLGAWEQYEIDVLKVLFFFRPSGKAVGSTEEQLDQPDDASLEKLESIVQEEPVREGDKKIYSKPPIWTWVRRFAENNEERRKIFTNVFGIDATPPGHNDKTRREWYDKRNAIAHGRADVEMTLAEYIDADRKSVV